MFQVLSIPAHVSILAEQLGTKHKFWFQNDAGIGYLFKEITPHTGEDWSEKIASELCEFLGLPHAVYGLAIWQAKRGVVCPTFIPPGGGLVHGNELLARRNPEYPVNQRQGVSQHTLQAVLTVVENTQIRVPLGWQPLQGIVSAADVFVGYVMLDAWIANQDRHHENWGLVVSPEDTRHLAPSYDHASSLGRNETDENRQDRLTTRDKRRAMEWYVERATSAFYMSPSSTKPMSMLDVFREAGRIQPAAAKAWLIRLESIPLQDIQSLFEQLPPDRISLVAIDFALRMLKLNRQRLLALKEVFV